MTAIGTRFVVAFTVALALASASSFRLSARVESAGPASPDQSPQAGSIERYTPVTAARLLKPADGDWLMVRRTYDGWGYSPLSQITPANVARLQPVWSFPTGAN